MKSENKPERLSWIVPYLSVKNVKKSVDLYTDVFGFELVTSISEPSGIMVHAELRYQDISIMCGVENIDGQCGKPPRENIPSPISFYIYKDNLEGFLEMAKQSNIKKTMDLIETSWNDKICGFLDLDGYSWIFASYLGKK